MKARPTIFLSGVTHELGTFRDAVEKEVKMKGCFAENQPGFPPDYRTVEEMLRRKLHDADAVIHIVGFRFGAEPNQRPAKAPRRSYTQMEFDIAREMQKPVYVFLSTEPSVRDAAQSEETEEDAQITALQRAHRQAVQSTNHLYYFFKDKAELCKLAAEIPPVTAADFRAEISRIVKYAPAELIGRDSETKLLSDAWLKVRRAESPRPHVLTFVALGGEGKTSLVAKWAAELAHQDWPGCDAAFAWSFYSQGTREQMAASSDLFLKEALTFFGDDTDKQFAASPVGAFEKGQRLARIVGQRRSLLILDGLEPLQYPSSATAFEPGQLKDQGIAKLLKDLATTNQGLCIVTSRIELPDLKAFKGGTVIEQHLKRLSRKAGVDLLKRLGVKGSELRNLPLKDGDEKSERVNEFETLVEDVKGHALTLTLLGGFLKRAFHGDIRQRDRVKFEKADEKMDGGHAFRTMAAYEQWLLRDGGEEGQREVAVLRLMGLFDRPADAGCLAALRGETIPGLTEPLAGLADDDWEYCLTGLEAAKLLTVNRDTSGTLVSLDAHPHLREYFARQLRAQQPDAWRAAHRRLYEHLCATTKDKPQPTLEDLQPLYQAIAHGCQAELHSEALGIYRERINRGFYSTKKLGVFGSDLGAVACFFLNPWKHLSDRIPEKDRVFLLREAGVHLRALGRLAEARESQKLSLETALRLTPWPKSEDWKNCAISSANLSELCLKLGELDEAVEEGRRDVDFSDRILPDTAKHGDSDLRIVSRTALADALHQAGRIADAEILFREAEKMQAHIPPNFPLLFSLRGFYYCDLLLASPERAAWKSVLGVTPKSLKRESLIAVSERAARTLKFAEDNNLSVFSRALDHLILGRTALTLALSESESAAVSGRSTSPEPEPLVSVAVLRLASAAREEINTRLSAAMEGLRLAGRQDFLPFGLLVRAWLRFLTGARTGPESAQEDLDEAWEIAERGPMKLFLADIHLYRARLFGRKSGVISDQFSVVSDEKYPWETPAADLAAAEKLINDCGYHRRDEELADAKKAILGQ